MGDPVEYETCTPDARTTTLDALCELRNTTHLEALRLIRVADELGDWKADGAHSMADWLVYRYNLPSAEARAWVAAATALAELPQTAAVYAQGRVSFDQITNVVSFARPVDDAALAEDLASLNAAQVQQWARARRAVKTRDADQAQRRQGLRLWCDRNGLGKRLSGYLTNEAAGYIEAALERRSQAAGPDPETGVWGSEPQRWAQALHELCADDLAVANDAAGTPDASVVVIHVPEALTEHLGHDPADGESPVDASATIGGRPIAFATTLRLLCDTLIEMNVEGPDGRTVGIGRASRRPPRWLRRRVLHRDGGRCRWPGCSRPIRHIHHLQHWTAHGPTDAHNLLGVCWHHHHLLHEGNWQASGNADTTITFTSPDHSHTIRSRAGPLAA